MSIANQKPNAGQFKKGQKPWNCSSKGKKKHSKKIKKRWKEGKYKNRDFSATKNPNYKTGDHIIPPYKYILNLREKKCEICKSKYIIIVHHKDGNRKNNSLSNLQVLCQGCHMVIHCHGEKKANERAR